MLKQFTEKFWRGRVEKTKIGYPWSKMPDQAVLTFIDYNTKQPYKIGLSLKDVNTRVLSGQCKEVTIRILGYDKAEIDCE